MQISPQNPHRWAQETFGSAKLGDSRRTDRLVTLASQSAKHTGKSLAAACEGDEALLEGSYRLIRNPKVEPMKIRQAGYEHTAELMHEFEELLVLEDTTSLSYRHQTAEELGKMGKKTDKSRGFWVHSALVLDARTYLTIGLVNQDWWLRPDDKEDADLKESGKWADSSALCRHRLGEQMAKVITVCDREADLFEYLEDKCVNQERFIVRAQHMRTVQETGLKLPEHLLSSPSLGGYTLHIPQKGLKDKRGKRKNRPARQAQLEVYSRQITIAQRGKEPLTFNAVMAKEVNPPQDDEALCWLLLTTEPVGTLAEALKVIQHYAARWRIEDFHKAWKSGAGVEDLRMATADNLERMASILGFIAVRLMQLRESFTLPQTLKSLGLVEEAKEVSQMSASRVLTPEELKLLIILCKQKNVVEPTSEWAYMQIVRLGGFNDTKRTGIASWDTLWKGWKLLQDALIGFVAAKEAMAAGFEI